ncbi:MAG: VOC family protein [Gammaproteobacteria bacterium]|nr:VOC family protein [Gammaproteobacteria bacterium]
MLGDFLEISVHSDDVLESLRWYQKLGFTEIRSGDTWTHPYGVVTDGRCFIGLHAYEFPSPSLTFVAPDLRNRVEPLEAAGAEFEFLKLADTQFHELGFFAPDEQMVCLIEARTFTPVPASDSLLGYFAEIRLPVDDQDAAAAQWQRYGLIENELPDELHDTSNLCCTGLNIGLTEHRKVKRATLVFHTDDIDAVLQELEKKDIEPRAVETKQKLAWLRSPEGLDIAVAEINPSAGE